MPTQLKAPSFQESHLHAPSGAGAPALTITATTCPSRILRASCRELKRLSSLRSRPNLGLRCGPNYGWPQLLIPAADDGCRPPLSENISCPFFYTSRQVPVRCREMLFPPISSQYMRPSSHKMPSFRIYLEAYPGRLLWDLPVKANCVF